MSRISSQTSCTLPGSDKEKIDVVYDGVEIDRAARHNGALKIQLWRLPPPTRKRDAIWSSKPRSRPEFTVLFSNDLRERSSASLVVRLHHQVRRIRIGGIAGDEHGRAG